MKKCHCCEKSVKTRKSILESFCDKCYGKENLDNIINAWKLVNTIDIFSKDGWRQLNKECNNLHPHSSPMELADGFITFQEIWIDDNEIDYHSLSPNEESVVQDVLIERWVDYLQND